MEGDPEVQKAQARYDAAHGAIGSIDGEGRVLHEEVVLVPEHLCPRRDTEKPTDANLQLDQRKDQSELEPAGDALGRVAYRVGCLEIGLRAKVRRGNGDGDWGGGRSGDGYSTGR